MSKVKIGEKYQSHSCNQFTVVGKVEGIQKYKIIFDEINGVKYETIAHYNLVVNGKIKNPYYPTIYGVAYLGNATNKDNPAIYTRWKNMLKRVYDEKHGAYQTSKRNDVTICERWHCFENFLNDFVNLPGYIEDFSKLQLDKDKRALPDRPKIYSPETCELISGEENKKLLNFTTYVTARKCQGISPKGKVYVFNNQNKFAEEHDLIQASITSCLKGKSKQHRGWKFKYVDEGTA